MIKWVVFDIDGVLTDGCLYVDAYGQEQKKINLKDIDAVFEIKRRGYKIAAITGEGTPMADYMKNRFEWDFFEKGVKKKLPVLQKLQQDMNLSASEICYVGDGRYDIEPMSHAGLGICPADAISDIKDIADIVLTRPAGSGGIWEMLKILEAWGKK